MAGWGVGRGRVWWGVAALCLLQGSGWLVNAYWPSPLPALGGQAARDALLAFVLLVAALLRRSESFRWSGVLAVGGWAGLLLVLPGGISVAADGKVSGFTATLATTLVPVAVVFMVAQAEAGFGDDRGGMSLLVPALVGFGGAGLLLPYSVPGSVAGKLWLLAMVAGSVLIGVAVVRLNRGLSAQGYLSAVTTVAAAACLCGLAGHFLLRESVAIPLDGLNGHDRLLLAEREVTVALLLDGPSLLLTVWLLRALRPVGFSATYLLVPLVSIVEAYGLMRPSTDWTFPLGLVLVLAGAWGLLRARGSASTGLVQEP